jgi:hypothetical protein
MSVEIAPLAVLLGVVLTASAQNSGSEFINFSQFGPGTYITNQYQSYGILFNGSTLLNAPPFIEDNVDSFATALIGEPIIQNYNQTIVGTFVNPTTGNPTTVSKFQFDGKCQRKRTVDRLNQQPA